MTDFPVQTCRDCGIEKPLTEEFWHKDSSRESGLRTACKVCVNNKHHVGTQLGIQQTLARIENNAIALLDKICEMPCEAGKRLPHVADAYQASMNVFGGVDGFARQVGSTYFGAKPGSTTRQKILDSIMRWGIKASEMGMIERDLALVPTEDIERLLNERMKEEAMRALPAILEMSKQDEPGLPSPLADAG